MEDTLSVLGAFAYLAPVGLIALAVVAVLLRSFHYIEQTEVGVVSKRWGKKLPGDNAIAFEGEAGYQAELLKPGWRLKLWPLFAVEKHPWVQIPDGQIGLVIAQVGQPILSGRITAEYKEAFGNFTDLRGFVDNGGQQGTQRHVLPPGTVAPIHPIGFLVLTKSRIYGSPIADEHKNKSSIGDFGYQPKQFDLAVIEPLTENGKQVDVCAIVKINEGETSDTPMVANRLGGFDDIREIASPAARIEKLFGSQNREHGSYTNVQDFLTKGGTKGLQHDPVTYGSYPWNPRVVEYEIVHQLVVEQGQVAIVKAYVGLPTEDISGEEFRHGSIVNPGHRGIWAEPLRTGKYAINPRAYAWEKVPTSILTLNWADAISTAHNLDKGLSQIIAKSKEGFVFKIDLQVQIHIPETKAARVISRVGTIKNLVEEVLQAAVGNHFRDTLQSMGAMEFIQKRQAIQQKAFDHIKAQLAQYEVETVGVYIQDVVLPEELVQVLREREIATQRKDTFDKQREAEDARKEMMASKGTADAQADLARSEVDIEVAKNKANARKSEADGEATYISQTGRARAAEVEAVGLARAKGYEEQVRVLGSTSTAIINVATTLSDKQMKLVPDVLVAGGSGGAFESLAAVLTQAVRQSNITTPPVAPASEAKLNNTELSAS